MHGVGTVRGLSPKGTVPYWEDERKKEGKSVDELNQEIKNWKKNNLNYLGNETALMERNKALDKAISERDKANERLKEARDFYLQLQLQLQLFLSLHVQ